MAAQLARLVALPLGSPTTLVAFPHALVCTTHLTSREQNACVSFEASLELVPASSRVAKQARRTAVSKRASLEAIDGNVSRELTSNSGQSL